MAKRRKTTKALVRKLRGRRWTAEDAHRVIAAWRESGLSALAFAREHGLTAQRLYWWSKRLSEWDGGGRRESSSEVQLARAVVSTPAQSAGTEPCVTVHVAGGLVVEATSAAPTQWLATLLSELSRRQA